MKRLERFRRRTLRNTILIFMPVITVFASCKYDEHVGFSESVKKAEYDETGDYEPVLTDRSGGILCYSHGYGSEHMEFIQISADGSIKSDGSYYWFDKNKNGNMDEEGSFIGPGDIDMGRYVRYMEEQNAKQAGNKLKWTGRRRDHSIIL